MIKKTIKFTFQMPELEGSKKLIIRKNRSVMQFSFIQLRYFCMVLRFFTAKILNKQVNVAFNYRINFLLLSLK